MPNLELSRPLAVFDIEATGISTQSDRIIELAIVRMMPDGSHDTKIFLVNPGMPIPPESTRIHGFSDEDVVDAPLFSAVASEIAEVLDNCDLAGFNVTRFDIPMLLEEFKRVDLVFDIESRRVVDAQRIFHQREPRDLTAALAFYCNEMHLNAHGAAPDAEATARIIEAQLEHYKDLPRDVASLDDYCNPREPEWVDRMGRLKWVGDEVVLNFGKKKGTALRVLVRDDPGFIKWMLRSDFPSDVKDILENAQGGEWPELPKPADAVPKGSET
jgi:DNA polymerase-3 subunit epsilon